MSTDDEFFIGWQGRAPLGLARFARARVAAGVAVALARGGALAAWQRPFAAAHFEFGVSRVFEGTLEHVPYPTLVVARPDAAGSRSGWLLTRFGKVGAEDVTSRLDGRRVRFEGSLVHRDGVTMVELDPATLVDLGPRLRAWAGDGDGAAPAAAPTRRAVTLRGEIVDSKCFLGVMKPGDLKTHRACAVRCISGGVPPALVVRDAEGRATYYLLVDEDGAAVNERVLGLVAEPLEVTGTVEELDSLLVLRASPDTFRRL